MDDFFIVDEHLDDRAAEEKEQAVARIADDQAAFLLCRFDRMEALL